MKRCDRGCAGRLVAWLSVLAAAAALGGCSGTAEREQYLASRSYAIEPGAASATDRPIAMFAGDLLD